MNNRTCKAPGCDRPENVIRWQLCSRHYQRDKLDGTLGQHGSIQFRSKGLDGTVHFMSDADMDAGKANCSACGPYANVRVRQRNGFPYLVCRTVDRQYKLRAKGLDWTLAGNTTEGRRPPKRAHTWPEVKRRRYANLLLEPEERAALFEDSPGCEICGSATKLVIDHSHASGKIRGVLCHRCNVALGWMNDSIPSLTAAIAYLEARG